MLNLVAASPQRRGGSIRRKPLAWRSVPP